MVTSVEPPHSRPESKVGTTNDEKHGHNRVDVVEANESDDAYLEHLGYKPEFRRDFSFLGLFSLVSSELAVLPGVAGTIWYVVELRSL
jgi:hypothetical protein